MIEDRAYMCLIYSWVERGCPPFIVARLTNRFHYWVLFMKTIDLKVCFICVNMCFIINRMTIEDLDLLMGTMLTNGCTVVYTELPV